MPYFDGTGPRGKGPNTGRGFGHCNSDSNPSPRQFGAWRSRGFGFNQSNRNLTNDMTKTARISALEQELKELKRQ